MHKWDDPGDHEPRIYFVRAENGLIKIGVTTSVNKRMGALRHGSPVPLQLLAHMPGGVEVEISLHRKLAEHRVHGEWFRPAQEVLACATEALAHDQKIPKPPPRNHKTTYAANWMELIWGIEENHALAYIAERPGFAAKFYECPSVLRMRMMIDTFGGEFCCLEDSMQLLRPELEQVQ